MNFESHNPLFPNDYSEHNPFFDTDLLRFCPTPLKIFSNTATPEPIALYTRQSKWGIPYVYPPFLLKYWGLFPAPNSQPSAAAFLDFLYQQFPYGEYNFQPQDSEVIKEIIQGYSHKFQEKTLITHRLSLAQPYEEIWKNYHKKLRRDLRKYAATPLPQPITPREFLQVFDLPENQHIPPFPRFFNENWESLAQHLLDCGKAECLGIRYQGRVIATSFLFVNDHFVLSLIGATSQTGRELKAKSVLFNAVIQHYANSSRIFDFCGGQMPNIGRFVRSFGAHPTEYMHIKWNRLPFPLNRLKK